MAYTDLSISFNYKDLLQWQSMDNLAENDKFFYDILFGGTNTTQITRSLGSVTAPGYSFIGDTNTGMYSSAANTINFSTDGVNRFSIDSTGVIVINEDGLATSDLRIEGDSRSDLFFIDASADKIGIGTTSPAYRLQIGASGSYDGTLACLDSAGNIGFYANGSTYTQVWQTLQCTNELFINTTTTVAIYLKPNGTEQLRIDPSVGVVVNEGGSATFDFRVEGDTNANLFFLDASADIIMIGTATPQTGIFQVLAADDGTAIAARINAAQAAVTTSDVFIGFYSTTGLEGSVAGTAVPGVIAYNTFTGSHWSKVNRGREKLAPGMLLEATGEVLSDREHLSGSRVCSSRKLKAVYGAWGGTDLEGHDLVLSIGTGFITVINTGKPIEAGDFLTSSDEPGMAELQEDDVYHNYTAAKAMENVKWRTGERARQIACIYLGG